MKFRFILALLLLRVVCVAQTTSVTLQVTDADSQTWNNGTWSATLTSNASNGPFAILGTSTPVPNQSQSGALSASGGATMTLTPNASIGPLGTQWAFHACPQAVPAACYDFKASIQGASQNLTLTPPGIRISVVNPIIVVSAYQDLEITGQSLGSRYYNLATLLSKEWNGSSWVSITPGGVPGGSPTQIQINNSGVFGGISNVAAGSTLVSNGISSLPIFQTKPSNDVRDLGVTLSGDQASNITNAWNTVGSGSGIIVPNLGNITLGSSVAPNPLNTYSFEGIGGEGQVSGGTHFNWAGGASPAFNLDQQRDSIFGRLYINLNGVSGAGGVLVSQNTGFTAISSHNFYHDINIGSVNGAGAYGFRIIGPSDSTNNNEGHTLWRISTTSTSTYNSGSSGIFLGQSANARNIGIYESEPVSVGTAFNLTGGSWHVIGGLTEQSLCGLLVGGGAQGGTYAFVHDEGTKQGICPNGGSTSYNYLLLNDTYEVDTPDLTKSYWDLSGLSNVVSIANTMKTNANVTKMVGPVAHSWYSFGDILPNGTITSLPNLPIFPRSISIGTITPFTGGNISGSATDGGISVFTISKNNQTDDNDSLTGPVNALWLGPSEVYSIGATQWYSSPGFTLAGTYNDGSAVIHQVPFRYKVLLTDATGTSAATWKLLPPKDPVTGTTYAGVLNFDYQTNGNTFLVHSLSANSQIVSTLATGTAPLSIASTTPVTTLTVSNHPTLEDCGTTSTCSTTQKTAALIVRGSVAFPTATTVTVTALPFTGAANYSCTASDVTTAAGVINATTYTSGSSVTFTETNGVNTDTIRYICVGF